MTELNDQMLLTRYLRGGDEAFRQLLNRHSGLVYGTALRVTGDPGAAEEVSQDVFVLLAKKARSMVSHASIAGWLHRTSHNMARHEQRRRIRQQRKVNRAADALQIEESAAGHAMSEVDEAVSRLPKLDREAILLRFFEDLDYGEIAQRLDITEPTARKRVSRALKRLQVELGQEESSAAALGVLMVAAPADLLGHISSALPSAGAVASASSTTLLTTMTTSTIVKTAGLAVCGGLLIYGNVHQHRQNNELSDELSMARNQIEALQVTAAGEEAGDTEGRRLSVGSNSSASNLTVAKSGALADDLEKERALRIAAEKEAAELREQLAPFKDEVVLAYGKIEEIGRDFSSLFSEARFLMEMEKAGRLEEEEVKKRFGKFFQEAASMGGLSQQIIEMESNPEEGSEFFSAAYADLFDLDDTAQAEMSDIFKKHIALSNEQELSLKQITSLVNQDIPGGFEPEMERRMKERQTYFREVRAELREVVPAEKQADFDEWIEKDGIGFNNLTLKGMPLMFSLGGKQE